MNYLNWGAFFECLMFIVLTIVVSALVIIIVGGIHYTIYEALYIKKKKVLKKYSAFLWQTTQLIVMLIFAATCIRFWYTKLEVQNVMYDRTSDWGVHKVYIDTGCNESLIWHGNTITDEGADVGHITYGGEGDYADENHEHEIEFKIK